jgi:PAS domain
MLIPAQLQAEEATILSRIRAGERVDHYETVHRRKDGTLIDIALTVSPIRNAEGLIVGASKIARDITDRKRADALLRKQSERLETLNRLVTTISSDMDFERIVQRVTDTATNLTGAKFGAFSYNVRHRGGEAYLLFTLSGAPREAFERFGLPRATAVFEPTFHGTAIVRSDDIRADPRYGRNAPHRGMPDGHLPAEPRRELARDRQNFHRPSLRVVRLHGSDVRGRCRRIPGDNRQGSALQRAADPLGGNGTCLP